MKTQNEKSITEQIVSGSIVVILITVLSSPLGYGIRIILSRALSVEEFGLVYAVLGLVGFFASYSDFGFGKAASYFIPKFLLQNQRKEAWLSFLYGFLSSVALAIVLAAVLIIGREQFAVAYFKTPSAVTILPLFAVFLLFECIALEFRNLFIGMQLVLYHSLLQPIRLLLTFIFSAVLFFTGAATLVSLSIAWLVAYAVTLVVYSVTFVARQPQMLYGFTWSTQLFKKLSTYAVPNIANGFIHQLNNNADTIFLTLIQGVGAVGVYNIIYPVVTLPTIVLSPLMRVFFPIVASLHDDAEEGVKKLSYLVLMLLKFIPFVSLYFGVFIFLFAKSTILTLFTDKWLVLAEQPLMLISIALLLANLVSYLGLMLEGMGLLREKIKITSALFTLNMILSPVLIYLFGLTGLIAANAVLQLLFTVLFIKVLQNKLGFVLPFGLYAVYAVFFSLLILFVKLSGFWPQSLLSFFLSGGVYTVLVVLFASKLQLFDRPTIELLRSKFLQFDMLQRFLPTVLQRKTTV